MTQFRTKPDAGFTILEVLVVLIIVSLISVVLMQGLTLVLNLRNAFGDQMLELDRATVKRNLVQQPLRGLVPDFNDGEDQFVGTAASVSGLTLQPLYRRSGRATPFSLTLEYDESQRTNKLLYRENRNAPLEIAEWPGERAYFRFIGDANGWAEAWPPTDMMQAMPGVITDIRPPQLPELIYLVTGDTTEIDYAVAIGARRNRVPRDPPMIMGGGSEP
jgi:general secretion pathway protein J